MTKASNTDSRSKGAANRISMKQSNTFPFRLHEMLDAVAREGFEDIVSWIPGDKKAFKVHKPALFVQSIMPRFFSQTKYKSFQRQCNLWGFERLLHGPEKGGYEHPDGFFVRGNTSLVNQMIRRKIKRRITGDNSEGTFESSQDMPRTSAEHRRPSMVSCGSSIPNSNSTTTISSKVLMLESTMDDPSNSYHYDVPESPTMVSNFGTTAGPVTPDVPEGLYLPPPTDSESAPIQEHLTGEDSLFLEGLSAFFEDAGVSMTTDPAPHAPSVGLPEPGSVVYRVPPSMVAPAVPVPTLNRKRRLSMELFVASRQENSNEIILDLLTGSDTLQKSLEMELMCSLASM